MTTKKRSSPPEIALAVPEELGIPPDQLWARIDFYHQVTNLTFYEEGKVTTRIVDAMDIAHALAAELTYGTGLLPENTLWWNNGKHGPVYGLYEPPAMRILSLEYDIGKEPRRFNIPLPGLIFICQPGQAPYVYAVKSRPTKATGMVYRAPLCNMFHDGRSCGGSNLYPERVTEIPRQFLASFFTATAELSGRSKKHPKNIITLWKEIEGKTEYPLDDLVEHGRLEKLLDIR